MRKSDCRHQSLAYLEIEVRDKILHDGLETIFKKFKRRFIFGRIKIDRKNITHRPFSIKSEQNTSGQYLHHDSSLRQVLLRFDCMRLQLRVFNIDNSSHPFM